ncbi:MAG: phasin family protein [Desulforhopalus sp.]|nr:phasin family protein [Desulforhopalus sp.]
MIDLIKKAVFTGMGIAFLTKEKIDEFSRELIDKGKLSEQEGEKLVSEMRQRAEESKEALKKQTDKVVEAAIGRMQLARVTDVEKLQTEIAGLRKEIEALRNKQ